MVDIPKYQISKFERCVQVVVAKKKPTIQFAATIALTYHEFAYHQMVNFCGITGKFFKENLPENDPGINTYLNRAWAEAYSMYVFLRVAIEAVRKLNEAFLEEDTIGEYYKVKVKEVVDIANDIVKHPMFSGINSSAYLPRSLDIGGGIDVIKWTSETDHSSIREIHPEKDFLTICNYLEYIAERFLQQDFTDFV